MSPGRAEAALATAGAIVAWHLAVRWSAAYRRGARARGADGGSAALVAGCGADRTAAWPGVSVIVPAWQERGTIERCLAALAAVDYPDWEVVVVAGGDDGTFEAVRRSIGDAPPGSAVAAARLVEQGPGGKPAALNAGLSASTNEVVVVLDADGVVRPEWLTGLVAPLRGDVAATTGDFRPIRGSPVSRAEQMERIGVYRTRRAPFLQGSGAIAIRREVLQGLGGFRLDAHADDWVLDAQLRAAGMAVAFAPAAIQLTERPATLADYWANQVRWRRAHLRSIVEVPEWFLRDASTALRTLQPYVVAWALAGLGTAGLVARGFGSRSGGAAAVGAAALGLAWWALMPVAGVIEAIAYTGDRAWARDLPAPPALAVVDLGAAAVASLTVGRSTASFKGPRAARDWEDPRPGQPPRALR